MSGSYETEFFWKHIRMTNVPKDVYVVSCFIQDVTGMGHGVKKLVERDISRNIKKADAWVVARK
jgi:hypothetical protein